MKDTQTAERIRHRMTAKALPGALAAVLLVAACALNANAQSSGTISLALDLQPLQTGHTIAQTFSVSGAVAPLAFKESGTLPQGLAWTVVDGGLMLSGTPIEGGTFPLTVTVSDAVGQSITQTATLSVTRKLHANNISAPASSGYSYQIGIDQQQPFVLGLSVSPSSVPSGTAGTAYPTITFTSPGGGNAVDFTESGNLPQGLTATPGTNDLVLSGTPVVSGAFSFSINVADHANHTGTQQYGLIINAPPPLAISPTSIDTSLNVGDQYPNVLFTVTGGSGDDSLSASGAVPTGLILNGTTGTNGAITGYFLTGQPTRPGSYTFTLTATDAIIPASTVSQSYTINVTMPHYTITPGSFARATGNQAYSQSFSIAGNPAGYTLTMTNTAGLPAGLSYAASGETVTISGTPANMATATTYGPFSFNLTDQYGNVETLGPIDLVLEPAPLASIVVTTTPGNPLYSDQITVDYAATGNYSSVPTGYITATLDSSAGPLISTLANGAATLKLGRLTPGTHTLVYSYSGDTVYPGTAGGATPGVLGTLTYTFVVSYPPYTLTGSLKTLNNQLGGSSYNTVDSNDNLYLTEWQSNFNLSPYNNVLKYDPVSGNITTIDSTSFNQPHGIAVDSSGNLYIADYGNKRVVELAPSGTQTVLPNLMIGKPTAIALDTTMQNLWIVDPDNNHVLQYNLSSQQVTAMASGFALSPLSVAIAANGTAYIGTASSYSPGTLYTYVPGPNSQIVALSTPGLVRFVGLVFDKSGNLFIDDGFNAALYSMDAQNNLYELAVGISGPLAINSHGVIYSVNNGIVSFTSGPAGNAGSSTSLPGNQGGDFGGSFFIFFRSPAGTTLSSLASPANSPYQPSLGMTAYNGFAYADLAEGAVLPGLQAGSITATFSDGTVLKSNLYGTASNAELGFSPGNVTTATTNASTYGGITTDQVGNVYYSDTAANKVYEVFNGTPIPIGFTGLNAPTQVAVDGSGDVFVLDSGSQRILEYSNTATLNTNAQSVVYDLNTQIGNANPLASLTAFAMDGAGNLYLAGANNNGQGNSYGNGRIEMLSPIGQISTYAVDLVGVPTALALDSNSLLYSGDATGLVTAFNRFGRPGALATGLGSITSLAIEPSGTLYASTASGQALQQISPQGVVTPYTVAGVTVAAAVAVDKTGSLTVADNATKLLYLDNRSTQSFNFGPLVAGSRSAVQTTTLSNVGNTGGNAAGMQFNSLPGDSNFKADAGTTTCVAGTTLLAPGVACTLGMVFNPSSPGADAATLYTNINASTQSGGSTNYSSAFSGTALSAQPVATLSTAEMAFGNVGVGVSVSQTVTLTNTGGATLNIASIVFSSSANLAQSNNCGTLLTSLASCTITVTFTPSAAGATNTYLVITDNGNASAGATQSVHIDGTGIAAPPYIFVVNGAGSVSSLFSSGTVQSSTVAGGGIGAAVDRNGLVFSITADGTGVSIFNDNGTLLNTTTGQLPGGSALAIDGADQLWIAAPGGLSMGQILGSGTASITDTTLQSPTAVAIDISGNVWIADSQSNTLHEVVGAAAPAAPLANAVQNNSPGVKP